MNIEFYGNSDKYINTKIKSNKDQVNALALYH